MNAAASSAAEYLRAVDLSLYRASVDFFCIHQAHEVLHTPDVRSVTGYLSEQSCFCTRGTRLVRAHDSRLARAIVIVTARLREKHVLVIAGKV